MWLEEEAKVVVEVEVVGSGWATAIVAAVLY